MAACDLPTEAPIIDQRWIVPVETATISVAQLLPTGVTISGTRFSLSVGPVSVSQSLGASCPACAALNGVTAPAPAFTANISTTANLPANVTGADIASGTVSIALQNGFSFDPTTNGGSATIRVTNATTGAQLGTVSIASEGLPAGQTTSRTLTITGASGSALIATTQIVSTGGQVTTINTNQQITVTATPTSILVNSAMVNVANKAINIDPVALDVEGIDDDAMDVIQEGAIVLDITNPFGVSLSATIRINYPGGVLTRTISVPNTATSSARLTYTGDELRSFLGKDNVTLTGTGTIGSTAGAINVTPTQSVQLKAKLDVTIQLGG